MKMDLSGKRGVIMRLTHNNCKKFNVENYLPIHNIKARDCYNKLGQLEDIEDELGISLITLFKALKNGFYGKTFSGKIKHYTLRTYDFGFDTRRLLTYSMGYEINDEYDIKDYGKTWALTKEELL